MSFSFLLAFFGIGLIIGSFLNVVIFRLHARRSFGGRSMCMSCNRVLAWYELIPLVSFVCLRGRCLRCGAVISWQYPLVEVITGVLFAALFAKIHMTVVLGSWVFVALYAFFAAVLSLLLVIAVYDFRHQVIPDALSAILGGLAFMGLFFFDLETVGVVRFHLPTALQLFSGAMLSVPFGALWFISRGKWMGFGDAKLAVGLGWFLGPVRLLSGTMISFWVGAVVGLFLLALRRGYSIKSELPFAPFLVLGAIIAFFFQFSFLVPLHGGR